MLYFSNNGSLTDLIIRIEDGFGTGTLCSVYFIASNKVCLYIRTVLVLMLLRLLTHCCYLAVRSIV